MPRFQPLMRSAGLLSPVRSPLFVALAVASVGCASPEPNAPSASGLSAAIAPASISVSTLPLPASNSTPRYASVSAVGIVFVSTDRKDGVREVLAWESPYVTAVSLGLPSASFDGRANDIGDLAAWQPTDGVWIRQGAGSWSLAPVPLAGYLDLSLGALNSARAMAAGVRDSSVWHAAYITGPGAVPTVLPYPAGYTNASGHAINDAGDVGGRAWRTVGSGRNATTEWRAVFWRRTAPDTWVPELLPAAASGSQSAGDMNNSGQLTGWSGGYAVRWSNAGGTWAVETVAASGSFSAIDECGRVVGTTTVKQASRGFVWDGAMTLLPLPTGSSQSDADDITQDLVTGLTVIAGKAGPNKGFNSVARWTLAGCP